MNEAYYVLADGVKTGPFSLEEVIEQGISVDTQVCTLDTDWQNASYLPEFAEYFESLGYIFPTEENLAHFGWRVIAFVIDYFMIGVCVMYIAVNLNLIVLPAPTASFESAMNTMFSQRSLQYTELIFAIIFLTYNMLFELMPTRGTIGKRLFNLRVVDEDGDRLSFIKSFVRSIGLLTGFNIFGFIIAIISFMISKNRQAWYDQVTKTYVVRVE